MSGNIICDRCGGRVFKGECDCMGAPQPVYEADPILTPDPVERSTRPEGVAFTRKWALEPEAILSAIAREKIVALCDSHEALREQNDKLHGYWRSAHTDNERLCEQLREAENVIDQLEAQRDAEAEGYRRLRDAIGALTPSDYRQAYEMVECGSEDWAKWERLAKIAEEGEQ